MRRPVFQKVPVLLLAAALLALLPAGPAAADGGPWGWPLAGPHEVSRPFAPPEHRYASGHRGADLPSLPGAPVLAAGAGRVSYAGLLAGRGVVVVVHGALRTTYEPVAASVRVGEEVPLGGVLGRLAAGHAGCPVAACLHWGLRRGEDYLDPVRLVERGPVRLLPVDARGAGSVSASLTGPLPLRARPLPAPMTVAVPSPAGLFAASPGPAPLPAAEAAPEQSGWGLRAADTPVALAALAGLVLGLALLARPRPDPGRPPTAGAVSVTPLVVEDPVAEGPVAPVLELDAERLRRRSG